MLGGFEPGTKLGRYTLLRRLAAGSMAEVLLAQVSGIEGFEKYVVVKRIRATKATDPKMVKMFLDEARLAAALHHHHIVQVYDVGHEGNDYYFAMEYVHGEDLRRLLTHVAQRHAQIPFDHIVTITLAVASALHHAHELRGPDGQPLGLVHRDVTPANILVGYDGNTKVVDFGIAKAAMRTSGETRSGTLRGKVAYMAPEQCLGRALDRRSDVFALGIVLYELCTARRLFKANTDFLTMQAIVAGKIPSPSLHRRDLPAELEHIILTALAPQPAARFATCEEMGLALERMAPGSDIRISATALADYMGQVFGQRPEPWLVPRQSTVFEAVDVDFDGPTAAGLVQVTPEQASDLEILSPVTATVPRGEFEEAQRTDVDDLDAQVTAVATGRDLDAAIEAAKLLRAPASRPFDPDRTTVGAQADVQMLRRLSAIQPAVDVAAAPRTVQDIDDTTLPPRRDVTPVPRHPAPLVPRRDATPPPRRDSTPVPRRDSTPAPRRDSTPAPRRDSTPAPRRDSTPAPRRDSTPVPRRDSTPAPRPLAPPSVATWTPAPDEPVPSLAPAGRRVFVIASVAIVLVAIGLFVMLEVTAKPDAAAPPVAPDADAIDAPTSDDAAALDASAAAVPVDAAVTDAPDDAAVTPADAGELAPDAAPPATRSKPPAGKRRR